MDSEISRKKAEARRCTEAMRDVFLAFRARFEEELRSTGVTLPQLRMLKMVEAQQGTSAAAIARACHVTPQTLHAMLARATREGWIVRGSTERNHRFVTATLTPSGQAVLLMGMELRERMEAELWEGASIASIQAVREALEAGLVNLQRTDHGQGAVAPDSVGSHPVAPRPVPSTARP